MRTSAPTAIGIARGKEFVSKKVADVEPPVLVIVESRSLNRECLARCLAVAAGLPVLAFDSIEAWLRSEGPSRRTLLILCCANGELDRADVNLATRYQGQLAIIVSSDLEDPDHILSALDEGARGYLPTSLSLDVAIEAIRLVLAGGIFVPASSLVAARRTNDSDITAAGKTFTARQMAVVRALGQGLANKAIAYQLNMQESTVKVHVRHIMKKIGATNRTQVALMAVKLLGAEDESHGAQRVCENRPIEVADLPVGAAA